MRKRLLRSIGFVGLVIGVLATLLPAASAQQAQTTNTCGSAGTANDLQVVGLTQDMRLICFSEQSPQNARDIGRVRGLQMDNRLVGIDYRVATGDLYGLGNAGGVYTLNPRTGQATLRSRLNVALEGTFFGTDFNPAVDRLRIISNTGQNLRADVSNGATLRDPNLFYPPATPGDPATPGLDVTAAAYTNNDADPNTVTSLYDIDTRMDQLDAQAPANAGSLNPIGKLTLDAGSRTGFDIYSFVRNGTTVDVRGLASLTPGNNRFGLYRINLFTGRATQQGTFAENNQVTGIAIPLMQS